MKSWQIPHGISRAMRWITPFTLMAGLAACGGADSPPGAMGAVDAGRASQPAMATSPSAPTAAAGSAVGDTAQPVAVDALSRRSPADVVVASVLPRAKPERDAAGRGGAQPDSPARWLDADLPQGKVGQPVMVVVPGALPQEAATRGREQGQTQRVSR